MSKFIDTLMTKSASEAVEILATKYAEVQAAKRSNNVKAAGIGEMYDSVRKSFADLPEESRRAIIGGAAGAGIGGLGSLGVGYVKNRKLKLSDALYGALAGAVPGAAIGALSTPDPAAAVQTDAQGQYIMPPKPYGAQPVPDDPARPWSVNPINLFRRSSDEYGGNNAEETPIFSPEFKDNTLGIGIGGFTGAVGGGYLGSKALPGAFDLIGAFKKPRLTGPGVPAEIANLFSSKAKKTYADLERMNAWTNIASKETGLINKVPHNNDRLFGDYGLGFTRGGLKTIGGISGGILGFIGGANAGGAISNTVGDANSLIADWVKKQPPPKP